MLLTARWESTSGETRELAVHPANKVILGRSFWDCCCHLVTCSGLVFRAKQKGVQLGKGGTKTHFCWAGEGEAQAGSTVEPPGRASAPRGAQAAWDLPRLAATSCLLSLACLRQIWGLPVGALDGARLAVDSRSGGASTLHGAEPQSPKVCPVKLLLLCGPLCASASQKPSPTSVHRVVRLSRKQGWIVLATEWSSYPLGGPSRSGMNPISEALQGAHAAAAGWGSGSLGTKPKIKWGDMTEWQCSQPSREPHRGMSCFTSADWASDTHSCKKVTKWTTTFYW